MNKKQKKEPFSLKNMNGLSHDDARTCALDDMNCLNGQEEHRFSLQDMNATRSRPYRKYHLTDNSQIPTAKLIYRSYSNATICKFSCPVTGGAYHSARKVTMCDCND